ncbi:hypothetical protein M4D55_23450 [Metabacillus idriensis]|uniref:phage baseplate plug family protein n=1 Tax=Metabacillus idriensis TaxID=324768 RepID=UPI002041AFA8|nr:hypothetical protein [Metabacillus idriensis]MCM3598719.1 hypothetical protein [Metabacillus idriensis]
MDYIEIDKFNLPEAFEIDLAEETFTLTFKYNETADSFTVDLEKLDESGNLYTLVKGEKLILNKYLWSDFMNNGFPAPALIPLDESKTENRISWENLSEKVFLYIDDEGEPIA